MRAEVPANVIFSTAVAQDHVDYPAAPEVMEALARAEDAHFWHASRNAFIVQRLRRLGLSAGARVLDVGCGGGCVSAALQRAGFAVTGVDGHLDRVLLAARRAPEARFWVHDLSRGFPPLEDAHFEAILFFDVLEHLEDPVGALATAVERVRPGGWVAGTVPALPSLWSEVDVLAGHKKRYRREDLAATLDQVGGCSERRSSTSSGTSSRCSPSNGSCCSRAGPRPRRTTSRSRGSGSTRR